MYSLPILRDAFSRVSAFPFSSSRACVCALWHVSVPFPHASGWPCAPPLRFTLFDTFLCHPALADFSTSRHTFPYAAPLFSPLSLSLFFLSRFVTSFPNYVVSILVVSGLTSTSSAPTIPAATLC